MRGWADLYLQQFKITFAAFVQYRASIFIWMIGHVLQPLIFLVVWSAVSRSGDGEVGGFSASDFAGYFIAMMVVNHVTYTWIFYEFEYRIRLGSLSVALLRPLHPIHSDIVDNISAKLISLPMMLLTAVLLALMFRPSYHLEFWAAVAFVPSLVLAAGLRFSIEWTLALAAFWTTRVSAVNQVYRVLVLFLAGQIAPLALLPGPVQAAASILPFRWTVSFPVELLLGRLTPADVATGLAVQVAWLVAGFFLVKLVWRAGLRVYSAVGA